MAARPLTPLVDDAKNWGPVEWWRLEIRSFDDAPNARLSLAVLGPKEAWTKEAGRPTLGGCLMTLSFVFAIVAPAVAAAAMFRWAMTGSGSVPLVFAGLLTLLSLIVTACSEISLARRPRAVSMSILLRIAFVHVVPGIVVVAVVGLALLNGRYDPVADPTLWWLAPSVLDIAFHVWQVLRGVSRPDGPRNLVENLERSVGEIHPMVGARILRMRNRAISRLQERSKIDDAAARLALGTGLGALALTMAPELRSGTAQGQPLRRLA